MYQSLAFSKPEQGFKLMPGGGINPCRCWWVARGHTGATQLTAPLAELDGWLASPRLV